MPTLPLWLGPLRSRHGSFGLSLLLAGELLIVLRARPLSDFYFPFVWIGFTLLLDAGLYLQTGRSLYASRRRIFVAMFGVSAAFWWLFELFNVPVRNWVYVGAERYAGAGYVAFATLDFSTVLAAVWCSAGLVYALFPDQSLPASATTVRPPVWTMAGMLAIAPIALLLPVLYPSYAFGLIWVSMFFLLDPINAWLGRPSMIAAILARNWRLPLSFALGTLLCGVCWEAWNFWSEPKWIYHVPHVGFFHVFEMPILGYSGYLPFGLELFAMTNFVLPMLGLGTLTLGEVGRPGKGNDWQVTQISARAP